MVIDLGKLTAIDIDAGAGVATIGAGQRLGPVYRELAQRGYMLAAGVCPVRGCPGASQPTCWVLQAAGTCTCKGCQQEAYAAGAGTVLHGHQPCLSLCTRHVSLPACCVHSRALSPCHHLSSQGVGVSGQTLGGGIGPSTRKLGLLADAVVGANVVTPEGETTTASADSNPDLFWVSGRGS